MASGFGTRADEAAAGAAAASAEPSPPGRSISCEDVRKTFRIPLDRPYTIKQRVLHPLRSQAARQLDALSDVSFEVGRGEFFSIIGENGSGKSTLLKCLAGIYQPDRGRITVSGRVSPFIDLGVGFNPELPALDNVVVNASLLGIAPAEARRRFPEIIRFAELEEFASLKLKNYSSGMHVRLGFAAAIQADADVFLVDEVLAVGDARFAEKCFDTFRRFKRQGKTVVFVSHDLASVERFSDRVLLLEQGQVAELGDPHTVINAYRRRTFAEREGPSETGRWGDRSAEILDAWFERGADRATTLEQGEWTAFRILVRFHERHENPVFGTTIRDENGTMVFVTSTHSDGYASGVYEAGDVATYTVDFHVLLASGRYTVTPAVAYRDGNRFADVRDNLVTVRVQAEVETPGVVDLSHVSRIDR